MKQESKQVYSAISSRFIRNNACHNCRKTRPSAVKTNMLTMHCNTINICLILLLKFLIFIKRTPPKGNLFTVLHDHLRLDNVNSEVFFFFQNVKLTQKDLQACFDFLGVLR